MVAGGGGGGGRGRVRDPVAHPPFLPQMPPIFFSAALFAISALLVDF